MGPAWGFCLTIVHALGHFRAQQLLVVVFVLTVFWHGLWAGAPRADQLAYLHQVSQYTTLHDILRYAPAWNRTHSAGDAVLYRPVLYVLLGLEYACFGYDFTLWQALSIALHMLVALVLLAMLWKTPLRGTFWPAAITCLFAGSALGAEIILWNHITGYVLFCLLAAFSVYMLVCFFETQRLSRLALSLLAAGVAVFTYELGIVCCVLNGAVLLWRGRREDPQANTPGHASRIRIATGLSFLLLPVIYLVLSIASHQHDGGGMSVRLPPTGRLTDGLKYTALQIGFWVSGWLLPAAFRIGVGGRAFLAEVRLGAAPANVVNYGGLLLFGLGTMVWAIRRRQRATQAGWGLAVLTLTFIVAYSTVIAFGRSLERGLNPTLETNLYYAYLPVLAACMGVALFVIDLREMRTARIESSDRAGRIARGHAGVGLVILVVLNGCYTYNLSRDYRYKYSAIRLKLIDRILDWRDHAGVATNAFFRIAPDCAGINDRLPWFEPHLRRGTRPRWHGPLFAADVLFPEKSFALNEEWLAGASVLVTDIPCPVIGLWNPMFLKGMWETGEIPAATSIDVLDGKLSFINEKGDGATGTLIHGAIATSWGVEGRLGEDGNTILWSNGTRWNRHDALPPAEVTDEAIRRSGYPVVSVHRGR
jgi:hypothetical protein